MHSSSQVKAEKPAWYLGVIAGAVLRTLNVVATGAAEFLGYLEKGQLPPAKLTLTSFKHTFVLEGERLAQPRSISVHISQQRASPTVHQLLPAVEGLQEAWLLVSKARSACHQNSETKGAVHWSLLQQDPLKL